MSMGLRSYQNFESGNGVKLDTDTIFHFARVTGSDADAIIMAGLMNAPAFAVHSADNKLMTALKITLQDFEARVGEAIRALRCTAIVSTFRVMFEDLAVQAEAEHRGAVDWLAAFRHPNGGRPPDQKS